MNITEFLDYEVPLPITSDAYTVSSDEIVSQKAKKLSVYNVTNRISPAKTFPDIATDSRMVFFGLQDYIRRNLTKKITAEDVIKSKRFMNRACSFSGALPFNEDMWNTVVYDYGGYLPITIKGIPEGSTFFPNEPCIEVVGQDGFGELAAHIEPVMLGMWSNLTCRATITAHWKSSLRKYLLEERGCDEKAVDAVIDWFIHDFGMRASSNAIESETMGRAHLLFFNGTDTFNAAYSAWRDSKMKDSSVGTSILALAHRIVQSYEGPDVTDGEMKCFQNLYKVSKKYGGIASYVSDCYNFKTAVKKLTYILDTNPDDATKIVCRPDSGNAADNVRTILDTKHPRLRFIEGNGIKPSSMKHVLSCLDDDAFQKGIFGVGGYLRNSCNRDALSSKYALSAVGEDCYPVCKLSEEKGKMSIPGPTYLNRKNMEKFHITVMIDYLQNPIENNELKVYYDGRKAFYDGFIDPLISEVCLEDFDVIRDRANTQFNKYTDFATKNPNFGTDDTHLSNSIRTIRDNVYSLHKGN